MPRPKIEPDPETYFYVTVIDAERNKIRFGPLTTAEVQDAQDQIGHLVTGSIGLEEFLKRCDLWHGVEVRLVGSDGTDECLT